MSLFFSIRFLLAISWQYFHRLYKAYALVIANAADLRFSLSMAEKKIKIKISTEEMLFFNLSTSLRNLFPFKMRKDLTKG